MRGGDRTPVSKRGGSAERPKLNRKVEWGKGKRQRGRGFP